MKLSSHGLQLPSYILNRFQTWKANFLQRSTSGVMSSSQTTRSDKQKAKQMAYFFLQSHAQAAPMQAASDYEEKQDNMADALLQALAYSNVFLGIRLLPQEQGVIILFDSGEQQAAGFWDPNHEFTSKAACRTI